MTTPLRCLFCFFIDAAKRARARAQQWEEEKLPGLASPWHKTACECDRLAAGEKECSCGRTRPRRPSMEHLLRDRDRS